MATVKTGTVRRNEDGLTAIKTSLPASRAWFIFDTANGGYYSDGDREGVSEWANLVKEA